MPKKKIETQVTPKTEKETMNERAEEFIRKVVGVIGEATSITEDYKDVYVGALMTIMAIWVEGARRDDVLVKETVVRIAKDLLVNMYMYDKVMTHITENGGPVN